MPRATTLTHDDYRSLVQLLQDRLLPPELGRIADRYRLSGNRPRAHDAAEVAGLRLPEAVSQLVRDAQNARSIELLLEAIRAVRPDLADELPAPQEAARSASHADTATGPQLGRRLPDQYTTVSYLTVDERSHLQQAFVETGVSYNRASLLDGVSPGFVARFLPVVSTDPLEQLDADLRQLNAFPPLTDGTLPLERWLRNAMRLFRETQQHARFEAALTKVLSTRFNPGPAATQPEIDRFSPSRTSSDRSLTSPLEPPSTTQSTVRKRSGITLDVSHHQGDWAGFLEFALRWEPPFQRIEGDFFQQREQIDRSAVLVMPLPRRSLFTTEEIDYIVEWVRAGGGLFLMGNYVPAHHECNINDLAMRLGFEFEQNLIMPEGKSTERDCRAQVFGTDTSLSVKIRPSGRNNHQLVQGISEVAFLSSCSIKKLSQRGQQSSAATYILRSPERSEIMTPKGVPLPPYGFMPAFDYWEHDRSGPAPVLAACQYEQGRVVMSGAWKICTIAYKDNPKLVKNILQWLATPSEP